MTEVEETLDVETTPHDVVEISNKAGKTKKIALLGFLTEDPSVYRPDAFGGATIEKVEDSCDKYLKDDNGFSVSDYDLVIPVTHQRMHRDRAFCEQFGGDLFPIVIAGHDHEPYDEVINGSRVIKVGIDAEKTAIIDITWTGSETKKPNVEVKLLETTSFPQDEAIAHRVKCHKRILDELEKAKLFRFDQWLPKNSFIKGITFSTENNRLGPSNGTTILTTILRMGMRCQCALINAGSVRRSMTYPPDKQWFTWSDLKAEIPFATVMCSAEIPGHVIEDMINYSRAQARKTPPVAYGGYMHTCDQIVFDEEKTHTIISICGEPFDRNKKYLTACPGQWFEGLDNHVPLLEWAKANNVEIQTEMGKPGKVLVVEVFAALLWLELGSFETIDTDGDGVLTRDEVRARSVEVFGEEVADLVVDSVFGVADLNHKGHITPIDMMIVRFVASDMLNHVRTEEEMGVMQEVAAKVLDKRASHIDVKQMVSTMYEVLDADASGTIGREEAMNVVGEVKRRSLLM